MCRKHGNWTLSSQEKWQINKQRKGNSVEVRSWIVCNSSFKGCAAEEEGCHGEHEASGGAGGADADSGGSCRYSKRTLKAVLATAVRGEGS